LTTLTVTDPVYGTKPMSHNDDSFDPDRITLAMMQAMERGDVDIWYDLWRMSPNEYDVLFAMTAQATRWARTAADAFSEPVEDFFAKEFERWVPPDGN
jgi:hypothetical protein